jgi:Ubiquitin-conjugating enzyme
LYSDNTQPQSCCSQPSSARSSRSLVNYVLILRKVSEFKLTKRTCFNSLASSPVQVCPIQPSSQAIPFLHRADIVEIEGTPYHGGYFKVRFIFGDEFPAAPPKCNAPLVSSPHSSPLMISRKQACSRQRSFIPTSPLQATFASALSRRIGSPHMG